MAYVLAVVDKFEQPKKIGDKWMVRCPCHDDRTGSLKITVKGNNILLKCFAECPTADILAAVGLEFKDLFISEAPTNKKTFEITDIYDYVDDSGKMVYQALRVKTDEDPKSFRIRRPRRADDVPGRDKKWVWKLESEAVRYPYLLLDLQKAPKGSRVWINNGEKACNAFRKLDLLSTCSVAGEGHWPAGAEFNQRFAGFCLVIEADNDPCNNILEPKRQAVLCNRTFTNKADCKGINSKHHKYNVKGFCKNEVEPEVPAVLCRRFITDEPQKCLGRGGPNHSYKGLNHAMDVREKVAPFASDVRILTAIEMSRFVTIPPKGDTFDFLIGGGTPDQLNAIADALPSLSSFPIKEGKDGKPPITKFEPAPYSAGPVIGSKGMVHGTVRDWWIEQHPPTIFARGEFYRYGNGLWKLIEDAGIENEIDAVIDRLESKQLKATGSTLSSIVHKAKAALWIPSERLDANPDYLVLNNGTLEIATGKLGEHNPDLYATSGVGFDFDPDAKCPTWDMYLERLAEQMGDDVIQFLQEFVGLCLTPDNSFEITVWLHGERGSGKGTFIDGVKAAMIDRYCVLGLTNIDQSRFMLSDLVGKTLAICQEQPGGYSRSFHILDQLVSGEEILIDIKHAKPFRLNPICKVLFAMTDLPKARSAADGIFRRAHPVTFPPLALSKKDPQVKQRIKKEGPGILLWALKGLHRLRKRGRFIVPPTVKKSMRDFAAVSDIEAQFLHECCYVGKDLEKVLKSAIGKPKRGELSAVLYRAYADWCDAGNQRAKSNTDVRAEWIRLGLHLYESKGREHWGPVRLKGSDGLPEYSPLLDHGSNLETHRIW